MIQTLGKLLPSVPASPPPAASKPGECNVCDSAAFVCTQKLSNSASFSCSCKASEGYDSAENQSVFKVHQDEVNPLDDWEFAGDEEKEDAEDVEPSAESSRDRTDGTTVPNLLQYSLPLPAGASLSIVGDSAHFNSSPEVQTEDVDGHFDEELGQSGACDWLEPPLPCGPVAMQERERQMGDEGVMLEAFQQFQHNPKIQKMVVALATDAEVWRAVLANKKLQEYTVGNSEDDYEVRISRGLDSAGPQSRVVSNFVLLSHNALRELKGGLREQIRGIMEVVETRLQAETHKLIFDVMLRAFTMMSVFMLALIAFLFLLPLQASQGT